MFNKITRGDIMKRAWQLKRQRGYHRLKESLSIAWHEAKTGQFSNWTHLPVDIRYPKPQETIDRLKMDILCLEMKDGWNERDFDRMRSMQRRLDQVREAVAA